MLDLYPKRFLKPLYDVAAIREREQASFKTENSSFAMMKRAAEVLYKNILKHQANVLNLSVVVGAGNNGGDGLVLAYLAACDHINVKIYDACLRERVGDARQAYDLLDGVEGVEFLSVDQLYNDTSTVLVDALLGIGFKAPLSSDFSGIIESINYRHAAGAWVVSVDCPSGLDVDTGTADKIVRSDLVVTFIAHKVGLFLPEVASTCNEIVMENLQAVDLSDSPQAYSLSLAALDVVKPCLRSGNSHKGTYGHVAVLGGDVGFGGAGIMASEAAAKSGAGTVCLYTQERHLTASLSRNPSIMAVADVDCAFDAVVKRSNSVVVVGPGLGQTEWSSRQWQQCLSLELPFVVDADGLYWFKRQSLASKIVILTPHPGEAAMLLDVSVSEILQNLPEAARQIASRYQAVVILKGAVSVVASPKGQMVLVGRPCAGLAKGGSGDVLSGMAGSCLAYYKDPFNAAVIAAAWHNKAAQKCEQKIGGVKMLPYQLLDYLE